MRAYATRQRTETPRGEDNGGSGGNFTPRPPRPPPPIHGIECIAAAAAGLLRGKASTMSGHAGRPIRMLHKEETEGNSTLVDLMA